MSQNVAKAADESPQDRLPVDVVVSIVVATYDRPDDLHACLASMIAQRTERKVEIIVVDNHPTSGLTPPVVARFPGVILVNEPRQGLAYARNAGFRAATGAVVVATDDDVIAPPEWLETLVAPFVHDNIWVVTGNTLPLRLETKAEKLFEVYGGLGKGPRRKVAGTKWMRYYRLRAAPTWRLGATANAAFRASIFHHPEIGYMDEALGPGMPSGVGEDTYLFYKVIKAGWFVVYEPQAWVWHKHRQDMPALRRQIFGYSKGHVAYNLTTWLRDGDIRGLLYVLMVLPAYRIFQLTRLLIMEARGNNHYSLSLLLLEVVGNLLGPIALWQSWRRVERERRLAETMRQQVRAGHAADHAANTTQDERATT